MPQIHSSKRLQIDKANATVTIVVAIASFLTIGSLVMTKSLLTRRSYQARVVTQKKEAAKQLEENIKAVSQLKNAYALFVEQETNVLGGRKEIPPTGSTEKDGDNAKITLDALPSKYDFPAVTTSLEKLLSQRNFKIENIAGTDDEVAQKVKIGGAPEPVDMPFRFVVTSSYEPITELLKVLENSIRPLHVKSLSLTAQDKNVQLDVDAKTYYLPEKTLNITKQAVK